MGRKERRKQQRLTEKEARAEYKKIYLNELNKMRKNILKDYCDRYVQLSIAATLLAVKDEKGLSENMELTVEMKGYRLKKKVFHINFSNKTAIDIINQYSEMGRHFEMGIKQVFHDLGLPLGYNKRILKEI